MDTHDGRSTPSWHGFELAANLFLYTYKMLLDLRDSHDNTTHIVALFILAIF